MHVSSCHFRFTLRLTFYFLLVYLSEPTPLFLYYATDEGSCIASETFGFPNLPWLVNSNHTISQSLVAVLVLPQLWCGGVSLPVPNWHSETMARCCMYTIVILSQKCNNAIPVLVLVATHHLCCLTQLCNLLPSMFPTVTSFLQYCPFFTP